MADMKDPQEVRKKQIQKALANPGVFQALKYLARMGQDKALLEKIKNTKGGILAVAKAEGFKFTEDELREAGAAANAIAARELKEEELKAAVGGAGDLTSGLIDTYASFAQDFDTVVNKMIEDARSYSKIR